MKASLDTNVLIHFYRAGLQDRLFSFFQDGVFIYEYIRNVELENHAGDLLKRIDLDIHSRKIGLYTDEDLKEQSVYKIFLENVNENRLLYCPGDLGEVYAISLAQTMGAYSLVTDDTKQGGPYMSLMQFDSGIMPFHFADVLLLRYLTGMADEFQTMKDFQSINDASDMKWTLQSKMAGFIRRFWMEPYRDEDVRWMQELVNQYQIKVKSKIAALRKLF